MWGDTYSTFTKRPVEYKEGQRFTGALPAMPIRLLTPGPAINRRRPEEGYGAIQAIDPKTGDEEVGVHDGGRHRRGRADAPHPTCCSPANREGYVFALDAKTGALLWKANVGGQASNGPITFAVGGRQYVAFAAGSSLFVYALRQEGADETSDPAVRAVRGARLGPSGVRCRPSRNRSPAPPRRPMEQLRKMSIEAEVPGLADPFRGITTNGRLEPGSSRFARPACPPRRCGTAADAFLAALSPPQRAKTLKPVDDPEWRKWMNQSFYIRDGASFLEMTPAQREAAFALMRAGLSARGLKQTRDIMRLNETLAELNDNNFDELGEWQYFITVMGTPSATEPWGWQFDGHHAVINYFVLGDQVVMTPFFAGSEPVIGRVRQVQGHVVLQDEQDKGLAFVNALDDGAAREGDPAVRQDAGPQPDRGVEGQRRAGLRRAPVSDLTAAAARAAAGPDGAVRRQHGRRPRAREDGRSAGAPGPDVVRLGRQDRAGQRLLLPHSQPGRADRVRPSAAGRLAAPARPERGRTTQHIHTVVRTPNGNDYGKDLLRQHYAQHPR